jgi:two-component system response regulator MprA
MATVLVADDDQKLSKMLRRTLVYEGFDVLTAFNGQDTVDLVSTQHPDLLILDWMMPLLDGIDVLDALRSVRDETPVLMLTARDDVQDRVEGLESGADDYLIKPFAPAELVARINALLRRANVPANQTSLTFADLVLDPSTRQARRGERNFGLTPTEFELLHLLLRHPHQVLPRRQILTNVWGYDFEGDDNVLEVYVGYLRKKMEADGEPRLIHTIRGVGYVLREQS